MQAVNFLTNWITWLLLIIPVGAGCTVTYLSLKKSTATDDGVISDCNTKIKTTLIASAIGMSISGLVTLIKSFYL